MISEFDARQLRKMKLQLVAFERHELTLGILVGNMDFLLNAIENVPLDWKQQVHEFICILEEVHSITLDRENTRISQHDLDFIAESINGIYSCLEEIQIPDREEQ